MGTAYIDKDPALTNSYFEEALRAAEKSEEIPEEMKKVLRADMNQLTKLITEESAENEETEKQSLYTWWIQWVLNEGKE